MFKIVIWRDNMKWKKKVSEMALYNKEYSQLQRDCTLPLQLAQNAMNDNLAKDVTQPNPMRLHSPTR